MTAKETQLRRMAKRWVCDRVAACLNADTDFFADVLFCDLSGDEFDNVVQQAITVASLELQHELERRGDDELGGTISSRSSASATLERWPI